MKRYVIKNHETNSVVAIYADKASAVLKYQEELTEWQKTPDDLFDYQLAVEDLNVDDVITDKDKAEDYLEETGEDGVGGKGKPYFEVHKVGETPISEDGMNDLANSIAPSNFECVDAFNALCTIARAWNKADGFIPSFNDSNKEKYFPWFEYDSRTSLFVCKGSQFATGYNVAHLGYRFAFRTPELAKRFGEMFIDLWNLVLLP